MPIHRKIAATLKRFLEHPVEIYRYSLAFIVSSIQWHNRCGQSALARRGDAFGFWFHLRFAILHRILLITTKHAVTFTVGRGTLVACVVAGYRRGMHRPILHDPDAPSTSARSLHADLLTVTHVKTNVAVTIRQVVA